MGIKSNVSRFPQAPSNFSKTFSSKFQLLFICRWDNSADHLRAINNNVQRDYFSRTKD